MRSLITHQHKQANLGLNTIGQLTYVVLQFLHQTIPWVIMELYKLRELNRKHLAKGYSTCKCTGLM